MQVLIGMPDKDSVGGPIYCEPPFVDALRIAGVDVDEEVYVYGDGGTPIGTLERVTRMIKAARRMRERVRKTNYDLIHLNTSFDQRCLLRDIITLWLIRKSEIPVFLKMHGSIARFLATSNPVWRAFQRRLFSRVAAIGVLSSEERANFVRAGCPPEKLFEIKNAFEPVGFERDPEFRMRQDVGSDIPIILFSSRFIPAKGLFDVIAACDILKNAGREFRLICLGDGPQRSEAERLAASLDLSTHISFTGYISEKDASSFHANSDIFALPTYHDEGFPVVILKSLVCGLPIITTRIRAAADYLAEPANCLWCVPHDPRDLAVKIMRLLDDAPLRTSMVENNRQLAQRFAANHRQPDRGVVGHPATFAHDWRSGCAAAQRIAEDR